MNEIINNTPEVVETMAETVAKNGDQMKFAAAGFGVGVVACIGATKLFKFAKRKYLAHKEAKAESKMHYIEAETDDAEFDEADEG